MTAAIHGWIDAMTQTLFGKLDDIAIERLRTFEPEEGYYVAYSGGKDSDVILDLVRRSGVKYEAHYHLTTCDPPEVVRHVKTQLDVTIDRPKLTMWQLIRKKGMPPRRTARYCCEVLKEGEGKDGLVVTGVRWGESVRRSKRKMVESCYKSPGKRFLNVIIDWTTADVWDYIRTRDIPYCKLYDEGFMRLGCVLCPMTRDVERQMQRWPRIARAWERAIKATWKAEKGNFESPDDYWQWWLDRDSSAPPKDNWLFRPDVEH